VNVWLRKILASSITIAAAPVLANGIAVNEQSASGAGTAYAGRSSSALDASTIYGNPAGLGKLKRRQLSGGLGIIDASDDISQARGANSGTNKGDSVPLTIIPFGYFSSPLDEHFTVGLGLYVPYGIVNDYEKTFQGASHGSKSKVQVITLQPTLAYRINYHISVGGGPTINQLDGLLENTLTTDGLLGSVGDTRISIKGDDVAAGYNFGVMIDFTDKTTWGLAYHSHVDYKLKGHTRVENSPAAFGLNGRYDAKLDITLPEWLDTSVTHKFDERWTGYLGAVWTRWSRLEAIEVRNSGVPSGSVGDGFQTLREDLKWHDTWAGSVGASYQLHPHWILRTGLAYDPSPTTNEHRNVRIPVGNRKAITLGAGWSPNPDFTLDVAYGYLWENTASVNQPGRGLGDIVLQPAYSAKYDNRIHCLNAQLTYRF
jgi:long-chain fatty acid transport protein